MLNRRQEQLIKLLTEKKDWMTSRELAGYLGISAANRPSSPCLATRLPYGTRISYELLERIDEGERYLRDLGFYNVRLRVHGLTSVVNTEAEAEGGAAVENIPC